MGRETTELVLCSLESWDDVWRRNQFLIRELLDLDSRLKVLFVEPPVDPLAGGWRPAAFRRRGLERVPSFDRLWRLRPTKFAPRAVGPFADRSLARQVRAAVSELGFERPLLWVNDSAYALLASKVSWPALYDITDDWLLLESTSRRAHVRLRQREKLLLRRAEVVVVCSEDLVASRGSARNVVLIRNAVDIEHFRTPRTRPPDLPSPPVALYAGTLHEQRLDINLCLELAHALPDCHLVLVGPNALRGSTTARLEAEPNIHLLGPRSYAELPGYLQHAQVIAVPHLVTPFTESLDPIKAYECLAVDVPTVATPVAGFRELSGTVRVVEQAEFARAVREALTAPVCPARSSVPPGWRSRAEQFHQLLLGMVEPPGPQQR